MTIETTANRISYTGSGTTGPFSFPYYFLADGDLTVIKTTIADGTEETLTITTDYTVSGAGEAAGGSVTLVATLSSSYKLTIIRAPDILQPADYPANDRFPAATHEEALDRATMILQRLKDLIDRSFRLSDGDVSGISLILSNLAAGELIAVNAAGTGIESIAATDVDLETVSAFIQTLLDDSDAATARATLGAAATGANTFTGVQRWAKGADVVSANALALGTDGNYFDITGTTTITSIGTLGVGTAVKLHFDAALTLTHHATDLILSGGANITTSAGDEIEFVEYATGDWRMTGGAKADGTAWGPAASQAEMEAGTEAALRSMSPLRVAQAIAALGGSGITLGTAQATTSGTAIDFTGIPAGTKLIYINFVGVSFSGTSAPLVQIGDSGGPETTGYSAAIGFVAASSAAGTLATSGFQFGYSTGHAAAAVYNGTMVLVLENAANFTWSAHGTVARTDTVVVNNVGGSKSLSAELDRVRITTAGGADTFDAGEINISYMG